MAAISHKLLKTLSDNKNLQNIELYLDRNNFSGKHIVAFLKKAGNSLTVFHCSDNCIGNEGLEIIAPHLNSIHLNEFYWSGSQINGAALKFLKERLPEVKKLTLCDFSIGVEGIASLGEIINKNNLLLNLMRTEISDVEIESLALILSQDNSKNIKELNLSFNNISIDGFKKIVASLVSNEAEYVDLRGNSIFGSVLISYAYLESLLKDVPGVKLKSYEVLKDEGGLSSTFKITYQMENGRITDVLTSCHSAKVQTLSTSAVA